MLGLTRYAADIHSYIRYMNDSRLRSSNREFADRGAPDGLPLPSPWMVYLVGGLFDLRDYYDNGALGASCIREILRKNGYDIASFGSILDFGCGCGRVMRQWKSLEGPRLYGSDYNPYLIGWCGKSLPFAEFSVNSLRSGLPYEEGKFDFVYVISVFTHLDDSLQGFWMDEMRRVIRPGGLMYLTLHGESYLGGLGPDDRRRFENGGLVVVGDSFSGSNSCAVFHPADYVRNKLARGFEIVEFVPMGARDAKQDVYLLKRTGE